MDERTIIAHLAEALDVTAKREEYDTQGHLIRLDLSDLNITQVPVELGQLSNLQRLYLNENPDLLTPPPEIVAKGIQETLTFLQALQHASVKGYETKLLLLLHPSFSTPSLVLNTWDFGGQDIYHATHQFFLTKRSLYLVVWNARTGLVQGKLDYWLDTIRVLAPSVPVLLVATHIDERAPDLNVQQYRMAYPQIVDVVSISSRTGEGLEIFKQMVAHYAAQLPLMGQPWPTSWVAVEQALLARPEHHIDDETYLELCRREGAQAEIAQGTLGGYLHDLGKVLYFLDDPILSSIVVLKPNWVTKTISLVLVTSIFRLHCL